MPLRDNLTTFLGYTAQTPALKPVFTALAEDLADEKHRTALTERALQTDLHFLASFLGYAEKTPALKPVFTALAEDLADAEHRTALTERALQTPLPVTWRPSSATRRRRRGAEAGVHGVGQGPGRRRSIGTALTERALQTDLHFLASFLGYAEKTPALKPAFTALAPDLRREEHRTALTSGRRRRRRPPVELPRLRGDRAGGVAGFAAPWPRTWPTRSIRRR